jgi:methylenetetrahydrofolate reductase (NADPH)
MTAAAARTDGAESGNAAALLRDLSVEITTRDLGGIAALAARVPARTQVAITFLPGEGFEARLGAARQVRDAGLTPVPHISARRIRSADELEMFVAGLVDGAAVDRVFVVAGDLPEPAGPYADALAVIRSGLLARYGIERVGISGYPEGHPAISEATLWQAMIDKRDALRAADHDYWITTQFGFDADPVLAWLGAVRARGVQAPVRIGIAGPASVKALLRFAARCGVGTSAKVMAKYGLSLTRLLGTAGPAPLVEDLAAGLDPDLHGDVRLHIYPFGGLERTADWIADFAETGRP